jgi:hypothetical protein
MPNIFQVYAIDARALNIRPPKVCDIQPGTIAAVYNFVNVDEKEALNSIRNGEVWDSATMGRVLTVAADKTAAAKG